MSNTLCPIAEKTRGPRHRFWAQSRRFERENRNLVVLDSAPFLRLAFRQNFQIVLERFVDLLDRLFEVLDCGFSGNRIFVGRTPRVLTPARPRGPFLVRVGPRKGVRRWRDHPHSRENHKNETKTHFNRSTWTRVITQLAVEHFCKKISKKITEKMNNKKCWGMFFDRKKTFLAAFAFAFAAGKGWLNWV